MTRDRIKTARILVTLPALLLALAPPLADFNATHVANPLWPPHARLHTAWLVSTNSLIAVLALVLVWRRGALVERGDVLLGAALVGAILLGFFFATAIKSSYGGALTDPNGIPFTFGPVDANLATFSVGAVLLAAAYALIWRDTPR